MSKSARVALAAAALLVLTGPAAPRAHAQQVVFRTLQASLDDGSLAGTTFPVALSYDADQVSDTGESYVPLLSFDFTLLGVPFTRGDIFQGGQAIFEDGALQNVTASFQVVLPPDSPVNNITFGFGGPGVIGYIDLANQFGGGSFAICPEGSPGLPSRPRAYRPPARPRAAARPARSAGSAGASSPLTCG